MVCPLTAASVIVALAPSTSAPRIIERIGEGGMGVVYKARDTHLDRYVALKVVREGFTDPGRQRRFVTEARAASALNHPNILTVHDISQDQGIVFIVMEYLDGRTLSEAIGPQRLDPATRQAVGEPFAVQHQHAAKSGRYVGGRH